MRGRTIAIACEGKPEAMFHHDCSFWIIMAKVYDFSFRNRTPNTNQRVLMTLYFYFSGHATKLVTPESSNKDVIADGFAIYSQVSINRHVKWVAVGVIIPSWPHIDDAGGGETVADASGSDSGASLLNGHDGVVSKGNNLLIVHVPPHLAIRQRVGTESDRNLETVTHHQVYGIALQCHGACRLWVATFPEVTAGA